jgi:hypothetical protein
LTSESESNNDIQVNGGGSLHHLKGSYSSLGRNLVFIEKEVLKDGRPGQHTPGTCKKKIFNNLQD